ncbi:MAG: GDSL-type esterase/lipase family protein [Planctomycetota bacterium]|nr:GDSL-type esterase/lipase family protein [Planctomycetota bacterium]
MPNPKAMRASLSTGLSMIAPFAVAGSLVAQTVAPDTKPAATRPATPAATQPATKPDHAMPTFARQMAGFVAQDAQTPPPAHPTVFIGASSVTFWRDIPATFKEFDALNRGFGGSRLGDLIDHLDEVVVKYKPRAVVIWGGNSDIASGEPVEKVFETYKTLLDKIHAAVPETHVFCLSIIPAPVRVKNSEKLDAVSALLREHAGKNPSYLHYLDARFVMSDAEHKPDPANYRSDELHPNEQGYAKLAPVIRKALHEVLDAKSGAK